MEDGRTLILLFAIGLAAVLVLTVLMHRRSVLRSDQERFRAPTQADHYEPWDNADGDFPWWGRP